MNACRGARNRRHRARGPVACACHTRSLPHAHPPHVHIDALQLEVRVAGVGACMGWEGGGGVRKKGLWLTTHARHRPLTSDVQPRSPRRPTRAARAYVWRPRGGWPVAREASSNRRQGGERGAWGRAHRAPESEKPHSPVSSMPCSSHTTSQNLAPIWLPHWPAWRGGEGRGGRVGTRVLWAGRFFFVAAPLASHPSSHRPSGGCGEAPTWMATISRMVERETRGARGWW